jgi:hypothetical protein
MFPSACTVCVCKRLLHCLSLTQMMHCALLSVWLELEWGIKGESHLVWIFDSRIIGTKPSPENILSRQPIPKLRRWAAVSEKNWRRSCPSRAGQRPPAGQATRGGRAAASDGPSRAGSIAGVQQREWLRAGRREWNIGWHAGPTTLMLLTETKRSSCPPPFFLANSNRSDFSISR